MKILQKLRQVLLYAGASKEEYARISADICKDNKKRFRLFSTVIVVFLSVMVVITSSFKGLNYDYKTYLFPMLLFAGILLLDICFTRKYPRAIKIFIYLFLFLLAFLAVSIGTINNKDQTAGTFLAFLLVFPLLFVVRPIENVCLITAFNAFFIITAAAVKETRIFEIDLINAIIFGCISIIISSYMLTVAVDNLVMQGTLTRLAETDILTHLQNRTSYERRIPVYPTLCRRSLACIYADVNGLHEMNEAEGHEAGDIMLKYTADVLKEQFGDFHTYRIGGDEFVAFAVDTDAESIENKLKTFKEKLEARGYFASVGYEIHSVDSIDNTSLIKAAENKMYSEKQEFYNGRGASLRRHPRYFTGNAESDKLS